MGYRLDELRASILRVQLRRLPQVVKRMRHSKYRIRKALEKLPGVELRRIVDPAGDTGCFLITTYRDAQTAQLVNRALRHEGIVTSPQGVSNVVMTDWGLHIYTNNVSLVKKTSVDGGGFPWKLAENAGLERQYGKGTCPVADSLFERSILIAIPSRLGKGDEDDIIQAFEKVLTAYAPRAAAASAENVHLPEAPPVPVGPIGPIGPIGMAAKSARSAARKTRGLQAAP